MLTRFVQRTIGLFLLTLAPLSVLHAQQAYTYQSGNVTIVRDKWGVPHIYGKTDADVAYGLAWASAEDDFETMQKTLAISKGYGGRVLGIGGAVMDFLRGLYRIEQTVDAQFETAISPEVKRICEAYCQAANQYAARNPDKILHKELFPVTPKQMVAGYMFATNLFSMAPLYVDAIYKGVIDSYRVNLIASSLGSNAIALNSKKTADGKTYIAINSHQPLEGLFSWYECHLVSEEGLNILGGTFPGGCLIFHGMTPNFGWAYTLNYNDFCDVYRLKINPKNKRQYWYDGQWRELEDNSVPLAVKLGGLTIRLKRKAYWSVYGPTLQTKKGTYAMRFPGMERIGSIEQAYRMNRAQNLQEFKAALNLQQNPSINVVYADRFDNLFYISNGLYPDRDPKYNWRYVVPGDTSATRWTRVLPLSAIPQVENPSAGFVFSVNNSPFTATGKCCNVDPATTNPTMGIATGNNNRAVTLMNNLDNDRKFTYEQFKRLKYDYTYPTNSASAQSFQKIFDADPARYPKIAEGLNVLKKWNRSTDTTNLQAGLFFQTFMYLFVKKKAGMLELDEGFNFTDEEMVEAVTFGMKWMKKHFGKLEVPYGEIQRHTKGKVNLAIGGMPDVLAAMLSKPMKPKKGEKGLYRANAGESYILLVTYGPNGPERIESVNAYGSSNVPTSPHYTDQMGMFVRQQTKPMTMDRATIEREAERTYRPE